MCIPIPRGVIMLYAYLLYNNDYIFYVEIKPLHNIVNTLLTLNESR